MPYKEFKIEKLFYTIGEVAGLFGESVSLIRFWSDKFPDIVNPKRNNKGNRKYTKEDIDALKSIYYLVKERGMTLEGAAQSLKHNKALVDKNMQIVNALSNIKDQLLEINKSLNYESN